MDDPNISMRCQKHNHDSGSCCCRLRSERRWDSRPGRIIAVVPIFACCWRQFIIEPEEIRLKIIYTLTHAEMFNADGKAIGGGRRGDGEHRAVRLSECRVPLGFQ